MASPRGPKRQVSIQTYHWGNGLTVRLEYDQKEEKQSVFLNDRLVSSFLCPPGKMATHSFRSTDAKTEEAGHLGDYRVQFAVEPGTFQIRYEISRKNAGGSDTAWYWYDRNVEPEEWSRFPAADNEHQRVECPDCGTKLICPECKSDAPECPDCGEELTCTKCNPANKCDKCGIGLLCPQCQPEDFISKQLVAFDVVRQREELEAIDSDVLKSHLMDQISKFENHDAAWPALIARILDEAGCDTTSVCLNLRDAAQDG